MKMQRIKLTNTHLRHETKKKKKNDFLKLKVECVPVQSAVDDRQLSTHCA